ncbi:MAG: vWA domain-containing protein [Acidobacteriota bacterium]
MVSSLPACRFGRLVAGALGLLLVAVPAQAGGGSGGPDVFGYTWVDSVDPSCEASEPRDGRPLANDEDFFDGAGFANVLGPFDLGFDFSFHERIVRRVWVNRSGLLFFDEEPPDRRFEMAAAIPTADDGARGFLAPYWDFLNVQRPSFSWESFPAEGVFQLRMTAETVFTGHQLTVDVTLFEGGDIRIAYPDPPDAPRAGSIGMESFGELSGTALLQQGVELGGLVLPNDGPFAACFERVSNLDCAAAMPLPCGLSSGSSPVAVPSRVSTYGCVAGVSHDGNESLHVVDLPLVGDLDVEVTAAGRSLAVFLLDGCDEWACLGGGSSTATASTLEPGSYLVVVDAETPADEGAFDLTVTCTPLATPVACEEVIVDTTVGQSERLSNHDCVEGADTTGPERWYSLDLPADSNLSVRLDSASGRSQVLVMDAAAEFTATSCLVGGDRAVSLFEPPAGSYLIGVDGPAGAGESFTLEVSCQRRLDCTTATELRCGEVVVGDTSAGSSDVDVYPCSSLVLDGPERVFRFDNPIRQPVALTLDDGAEPSLDLLLLSECNEGACVRWADRELEELLPPGTHWVVVDGRDGASGSFELTLRCPNAVDPERVTLVGAPGDCFEQSTTVTVSPELRRTDVLFALDLTSSMEGVQAAIRRDFDLIIDRLELAAPDLAHGLVTYKDHDTDGVGERPCPHVAGRYGETGDYPYRLEQAITSERSELWNAMFDLERASGGGDAPDAAVRMLDEVLRDDRIGWRPNARRIVVSFSDALPHDCNVLECLGATASVSRGVDLGRDGVPETDDELSTLELVQELGEAGVTLVHLHSGLFDEDGGFSYLEVWDCWAALTGGVAVPLEPDGLPPDGGSLPELLGALVEDEAQGCSQLELVAEPGFSAWLVEPGEPLEDVDLPVTADFDVEICIPYGTPEGETDFEIELRCGAELALGQVVNATVVECAPPGVVPPPDRDLCPGDPVSLDASAMGLESCVGVPTHEWLDAAGAVIDTGPILDLVADVTRVLTVRVTCSTDPSCYYQRPVTIRVDAPGLATARVEDVIDCDLGLRVSWDAVPFPRGGGFLDLHRSTVDCADALAQPPIATDLVGLGEWIDPATASGVTYHYVLVAEDSPGSACLPSGPRGGAVTRLCLPPIVDVTDGATLPPGVGATLRLAREGDAVLLTWPDARALTDGEDNHLLRSNTTPTGPFVRLTPDGDRTRSYRDADTSEPVLWYELQVRDSCGRVSGREFP